MRNASFPGYLYSHVSICSMVRQPDSQLSSRQICFQIPHSNATVREGDAHVYNLHEFLLCNGPMDVHGRQNCRDCGASDVVHTQLLHGIPELTSVQEAIAILVHCLQSPKKVREAPCIPEHGFCFYGGTCCKHGRVYGIQTRALKRVI